LRTLLRAFAADIVQTLGYASRLSAVWSALSRCPHPIVYFVTAGGRWLGIETLITPHTTSEFICKIPSTLYVATCVRTRPSADSRDPADVAGLCPIMLITSQSRIGWRLAIATPPRPSPSESAAIRPCFIRNLHRRPSAARCHPTIPIAQSRRLILAQSGLCEVALATARGARACHATSHNPLDSHAVVIRPRAGDSKSRSSHDVAVGRATSRAYSRNQSIPFTSAASCDAVSRITPSLICGRRKAPVLQPLPEQHQPGSVPGHDFEAVRPLRPEDENRLENGSCTSFSRTSYFPAQNWCFRDCGR
jgi:hypothetical protein